MQIPRLHPDTIEAAQQRADIVDVISEHVVLRKRGKDFVGLCPFHDEKTPSFSVSPSKQMYYCFGCSAGGNAIKFLMEVGKRPFSEVVLDLCERYQVPVQTLEPEQRQQLQSQLSLREQLYETLAIAAQFYQHALRQSQGQLARSYLQSSRQLSEETIQQFGLGYAPVGWETLYRYLVEDKRQPVQLVEQAGLILPRKTGDGYYDRFRDRLMIPIHDIQGRVIGFGGRTLGDEQHASLREESISPQLAPKYLNSPETELFSKGKTLFALDKARVAISREDKAVVVEGYFDAIALHATGITNAVASLGTALSLDQVRQLLRYTESKQLLLNFDADAAGTQASVRAIGEIANLAYRGEIQLRILNLPEGKDADEYLKDKGDGGEQYRELLATAPLWLDWQIQQIVANQDLKQANQFQQVSQQLVKLLKLIDNPDTRNYYVRHCAELLSRGEDRLVSQYVENLLAQITPGKGWGSSGQGSRGAGEQRSRGEKRRGAISFSPRQSPQRGGIGAPSGDGGRPPHGAGSSPHPPLSPSSSPSRSLLEKAEASLLRIYLHCPEHRQAIVDILEEQDLQFSFSHHRFLWRQILEVSSTDSTQKAIDSVSTTQTQLDLISHLQVQCLEFESEIAQVSYLFHPDEKSQQEQMQRIPQVIQAATARMEQVLCEKRYRHFLELWQKTDGSTDPETSEYYYQEYNQAKLRSMKLQQQCQFSVCDLL